MAYQTLFVPRLCINNLFVEIGHVFQSVWTQKKLKNMIWKNCKVQKVQTWTERTVRVWFRFGNFVGGSGSGSDKRWSEPDWTELRQRYNHSGPRPPDSYTQPSTRAARRVRLTRIDGSVRRAPSPYRLGLSQLSWRTVDVREKAVWFRQMMGVLYDYDQVFRPISAWPISINSSSLQHLMWCMTKSTISSSGARPT